MGKFLRVESIELAELAAKLLPEGMNSGSGAELAVAPWPCGSVFGVAAGVAVSVAARVSSMGRHDTWRRGCLRNTRRGCFTFCLFAELKDHLITKSSLAGKHVLRQLFLEICFDIVNLE